MSRSWLAALAFGILVLLTVFVLLPEDEPNLLDEPLGSASVEIAEAEAASVGEIPASTPNAPTAAGRAAIEAAETPELANPKFETYAGANGTLVTVVDKETGKPVASASLLVCLRDEIEEDALETALVSGVETLENIMRKYGHRYQTDSEGKVMVQPLTDYPMLYARLGNRSGFAYQIEPGETEVEVQIEIDLSMKIQVVDEKGASVARAPVALRMISDDYQFSLFTRDTNDQGILLFENMRPYTMSTIGANAHLELTIGALIDPKLLTEEQRVLLDDAAFERGEATLVLPPTGRVLVQTTLPDGAKFHGSGSVSLRDSESSEQGFGPPSGMTRPLVDGIAEFPHVVLGLDLIADVFVESAPSPDTGKGAGPVKANQTVELEVQRTLRPIVRARLLDAGGEVLRDARFETQLVTRGARTSNNRGAARRTDAEGWFELEFEARPADAGLDYKRVLRLSHLGENLKKSEVELDLSHALRLGVNDFGELQLSPSAVLLQGLVVDQLGAPISQANVTLQQARLGRDNEVRGWRGINQLQTRTTAEGRFLLQGGLPDDVTQFRLSVQAHRFETSEQIVQPNGQEMEVRLNPGSFITGSVLVDPEIDLSRFQLSFVQGEHNTDWTPLRTVPGQGGEASFEYQANPDTPYSLILQSEAGEVLHEQSGISTQRGETATPPGLQPLDLRGRLRQIELKTVDIHGKPVDASFIIRATENQWDSMTAKNGVLTLTLAKELFEVTVQHVKHASVTLSGVSQSQVIRMEPGLEITLSVPQQFLRREGVTLSVQMYPEDRGRGRIYAAANRVDVDSQGNATLHAPQAGTYRVSLSLYYENGNQHRSRSVSGGTIEVSSNGSVHPLQIDADRFADAIAKLKQENR